MEPTRPSSGAIIVAEARGSFGRVRRPTGVTESDMTSFTNRTVVVMLTLCAYACSRGRVGDRVRIDEIVAVEPGMNYAQVVGRMGVPFQMESELPEHVERGVRIVGEMVPTSDPNGAHVLLTYSESGGWLTGYPMVWVHLINGRVDEVYVKWYFAGRPFFGDDEGIYGYSTRHARWQNSAKLRAAFARGSQAVRQ
jgi:hypothetical protein